MAQAYGYGAAAESPLVNEPYDPARHPVQHRARRISCLMNAAALLAEEYFSIVKVVSVPAAGV